MLKNILKLQGAQQLTKNDQKSINGGIKPRNGFCPLSFTSPNGEQICPEGYFPASVNADGTYNCCPN